MLCDITGLAPDGDGLAFARRLITEIGVSCVPAASFWRGDAGRPWVRFAFPKRLATLEAAIERLERLPL